MKTQLSHYPRIAVSTLTLALSFFGNPAASLPQDIAGGASVVLASADVEAKLGKGIFTTRTRAHTTKNLEKKTVARSAHTAQTQKQTSTSGGKQETAKQTTSSGGKQETTRRTTSSGRTGQRTTSSGRQETARAGGTKSNDSTKALGDPAKRVLTAEEYNKQGDD